MSTSFEGIIKGYTEFRVEDKLIAMPYAMSGHFTNQPPYAQGRTKRFSNYAGKGTPEQISRALIKAASRQQFNLKTASADEIKDFMIKQGIGIDCSGLVYHALDAHLKDIGRSSLDHFIIVRNNFLGRLDRFIQRKRWVRRCSAATLTNDLNTIKIERAKDIQPGDMIRLTHSDWEGKHIAIVTSISPTEIKYAHSSESTHTQGPHIGVIKITHWEAGLEKGEWQEVNQHNKNYGHYAFELARGDSVRRLRALAAQS